MWHYIEQGQGRPLVLLHGIGMSNAAWKPVLSKLAQSRRVIVFDIAGFGRSPLLPQSTPPTIINLVLELGNVLQKMGIDEPVDIAGNSLGAWMALEAARLGMARSVVAISPAGLWHKPPAHVKHIFFGLRRCTRIAPSLVKAMLRVDLLREVLMAVPLTTGSRYMPAEEAIAAAMDFVNAEGFNATFEHTTQFRGGQTITIPVTIAYGTHDWLITPNARLRHELPAHVRWLEPQGWGHVPMWKDPEGVARLILEGTSE